MSFLFLKKFCLASQASLVNFPKFFSSKKQIDPKIIPNKYDVNPIRDFKYSYEDIPDNLEKSGRRVYKNFLTFKRRKEITKKDYKEYVKQENLAKSIASGKYGDPLRLTPQQADHVLKYLQNYMQKNKISPEEFKQKKWDLEEILNTKIPSDKKNPYEELYNSLKPEPQSLEIKAEKENIFEDEVWENETPVERKYDKITIKELFWIDRNERHYQESDRRINYLKEFVKPFTIHDGEINSTIQKIKSLVDQKFLMETNPDFHIENIYSQKKEISELFNLLKTQIMKTHYKQLPNIALSLTFDLRYKVDTFKVWQYIEKEFFNNIHHFDLREIAKMHYAMVGIMPKIGSLVLHKACIDLIKQEIKTANIYDLFYIYTSYKMLSRDKLHTVLYKELLARKNEVVSMLGKDPDLIANLFYTYANCKIKKHNRNPFREKDEHIQEAQKLIDLYYDEIMKRTDEISLDALSRLSLSFTLLRLDGYLDFLLKIEKNVLRNLEKLDSFLVSSFLYSFSKFSNGRSEGSLDFYVKMADYVEKFWPEFTNKDKARIFYAYASRGFTQENCGLFDKLFIPWANEKVSELSYSELSNTIMSLMYLRYTESTFWKNMIKNVANQKHVVPVVHYFAFQIAKYYISIFYPTWNFKQLNQALYEASTVFSPSHVPKLVNDEEFLDFIRVLHFKLYINCRPYLEWENLFAIDVGILPQKVGVLKQGVIENFQDSYEIRPFYKLKKFILDNNGWQVWIVNWKEYLEQGENKDDWFMEKFKEVYDDQTIRFAKKGYDDMEEGVTAKYKTWYNYWIRKLDEGLEVMDYNPETGTATLKDINNIKKEDETPLDSRIFATFGKQGVVKTPAGGAAGGGGGGGGASKAPAAKGK